MDGIAAYVFDAYGTLFDVHAAVARHRAAIGPKADRLSQIWRAKQLEYSWVHSLMGRYAPFWRLTERALDYAMARLEIDDGDLRRALLDAYRVLDAYPEVRPVLRRLKAAGAKTAVFSNGDPQMLDAAVGAAGIGGLLDAVLSVEPVGVFKTDPRAYGLVTARLELPPARISFQSSNRWDIAGAAAFGFRCVWINRFGMPDEYPDCAPAAVLPDLSLLDVS